MFTPGDAGHTVYGNCVPHFSTNRKLSEKQSSQKPHQLLPIVRHVARTSPGPARTDHSAPHRRAHSNPLRSLRCPNTGHPPSCCPGLSGFALKQLKHLPPGPDKALLCAHTSLPHVHAALELHLPPPCSVPHTLSPTADRQVTADHQGGSTLRGTVTCAPVCNPRPGTGSFTGPH